MEVPLSFQPSRCSLVATHLFSPFFDGFFAFSRCRFLAVSPVRLPYLGSAPFFLTGRAFFFFLFAVLSPGGPATILRRVNWITGSFARVRYVPYLELLLGSPHGVLFSFSPANFTSSSTFNLFSSSPPLWLSALNGKVPF